MMTKTDLQWLSHFLRRVVVHSQDEINALWYLVSKIEKLEKQANGCTHQTAAWDAESVPNTPMVNL